MNGKSVGSVLIITNPADEVAEAWANMRDLFAIAAFYCHLLGYSSFGLLGAPWNRSMYWSAGLIGWRAASLESVCQIRCE